MSSSLNPTIYIHTVYKRHTDSVAILGQSNVLKETVKSIGKRNAGGKMWANVNEANEKQRSYWQIKEQV
jgi:hypothetical protein